MKKKIKIYFTDFWAVFNIEDNFFIDLLKDDYDIEISDSNPDLIFYSVFGVEFKKFNTKRVFFTGENIRPNYNECDYSFSFDHSTDDRNYRLPLYALFGNVELLTLPKPNGDDILKTKTNFCNFIYSNPQCKERNKFFIALSKYKKVDSAGRLFNNTKFLAASKLDLIKDYKFTIAFENESFPGYTTEKIFEPMLVHSMPIYWGNNLINLDFNTKSFINCHDYQSMTEVIETVISLDKNDEKYLEYFNEFYFNENRLNEFVNPTNILKRLNYIIETPITPISQSKPLYHYNYKFMEYRMLGERSSYKLMKLKQKLDSLSIEKLKIKINNIIKK